MLCLLIAGMMAGLLLAQGVGGDLFLPDPLVMADGSKVGTVADWEARRRPEVLELFREHVYGRAAVGRPADLRFEVVERSELAMSGRATYKRVLIRFGGPGGEGRIELLVFIPNQVAGPAPGFLLICNRDKSNIDPTRQTRSPFWPAEKMIERGYVAATFHYADLDPDVDDQFKNGVHGLFDPKESPRAGDAWGSIAAWAWGASRAMDYFETDADIDEHRIGVVGHSRGGKTALWCGAEDERFALVVSNDSGCTGAALARRKHGETIKKINTGFPYWFCGNYKNYNDREEQLPVDQHQLIALMAPRAVYVASASEDDWADPEGEFLSCVYAEPVYRLMGLTGLGTDQMPRPESPIHKGRIGYHLRTGKHNLTEYDWGCFMDFADRCLAEKRP